MKTSLAKSTEIPTLQLREKMGKLLELVHYRGREFDITRKGEVMATLINSRYVKAMQEIIANDPSLEDTLWLMLDDEAQAVIEQSIAESKAGDIMPIEQAFSV